VTASATGAVAPLKNDAERRSHGRSPWREAFEALVSRPSAGAESSVSMTRNAKGAVQFEVVVRDVNPRVAQQNAVVLFLELDKAFPYPVEASVSPQEAFVAGIKAEDAKTFGGRSRARRKPEAA